MSWYNEAIFYHIYPLGLTGAPKQNDYSRTGTSPEHSSSMDRTISKKSDAQPCISDRSSKVSDMVMRQPITRNWTPVLEQTKI